MKSEPIQENDDTLGALSVADFTKRYDICTTKVYHEITAGRLKAKKFGSRTLILRSDARAWADSLPEMQP